jgi:outer membrane beta-barrel protein
MLAALVAVTAWFAVPGEAWAQNREKAWEVFPFLGYLNLSNPGFGDALVVRPNIPTPNESTITLVSSEIENDLSLGLRFGFHWSKRHMIEFAFAGSATTANLSLTDTVVDKASGSSTSTTVGESLSVDIMYGEVDYVYNFFLHRRDKIVAYLSGGGGVVITSVFGLTAEPRLRPILDAYVGETNDFSYNVGGGVRFFGSEKVAFRIDLRQIRYSPESRVEQDILQLSMGVSLILGGP